MKRYTRAVLLILALCLLFCLPAAALSPQSAAEDLSEAAMFRGTDQGLELSRTPKRSHARAAVRRGGGSARAL